MIVKKPEHGIWAEKCHSWVDAGPKKRADIMKSIKLPEIDCEVVCRQIGDFAIETVQENHATGCVVGLSGGVDSSTTAALLKNAIERYNADNEDDLELVGYILPSRLNKREDANDAEIVARELGIRFETHSIEPLVKAFRQTNPEAFDQDYNRGNMISRIRANVLSTKAATEKKVLAGTGNRDEDFGIGYYTLFGDGAVHFSPIAGLPKRLVRKMGSYLGLSDDIVLRTPTAGLEPGQTDFKDLGYDYDVVELVIEGLLQGIGQADLVNHEQIVPLVSRQLDDFQKLFGRPKFESVADVVADVLKRHEGANQKIKIVHPPTPEISLIY